MNKKKILLTGSTGFIGRNLYRVLKQHYDITAPKRLELDVVKEFDVDSYFMNNSFDVVIHTANISPFKSPQYDSIDNILDYTIRAMLNIEKHSNEVEKILYMGSGAEYNKQYDIKMVKENDIGMTIPTDNYGYAKYILNKIARGSKNIYNLRLFGCYGPTDVKTKFIRDAIDCCLENRAITIRQNCQFDYLYVDDMSNVVRWFIENIPKYHDYNVCSGIPIDLLTIAKIVAMKMHNDNGITIAKEGYNKEYTADNSRLLSELNDFKFTSIEDGISKQIDWQRSTCDEKKSC